MTTQLLNKTTLNYNLEISISRSKVMAFKGKYPVRSKIMINILRRVAGYTLRDEVRNTTVREELQIFNTGERILSRKIE
jgi:hypothetical protein